LQYPLLLIGIDVGCDRPPSYPPLNSPFVTRSTPTTPFQHPYIPLRSTHSPECPCPPLLPSRLMPKDPEASGLPHHFLLHASWSMSWFLNPISRLSVCPTFRPPYASSFLYKFHVSFLFLSDSDLKARTRVTLFWRQAPHKNHLSTGIPTTRGFPSNWGSGNRCETAWTVLWFPPPITINIGIHQNPPDQPLFPFPLPPHHRCSVVSRDKGPPP